MAGGTFPTFVPSYTVTAGPDTANNTSGGIGISGLFNAQIIDITALSSKIGTGASTPTNNTVLTGNGTGTSTWTATLTSFTLVTPTIASFANANHTHANSAGGGQLTGSSALINSTVTADKLNTGAQQAYVVTSEATASTSFVDLATVTDTITVTVGANGLLLVSIYAWLNNSAANSTSVGFTLSGANTLAAADEYSLFVIGTSVTQMGATFLLSGLSTGSTILKMKYKVSAGTGTYSRRRIMAVPL